MKILLAVDGSKYSVPPVKVLLERPWTAPVTVRVLTVVQLAYAAELGVPGGGGVPPAALENYARAQQEGMDAANAMVSALANQLDQAGFDADAKVRRGDPAAAILEEAEGWGADLILVGSHGRTGLQRLFMGSVAQKVVARARCSVEVARPPVEARDDAADAGQ